MATVQKNFEKFNENISLKSERIARITSAVTALEKFVSSDRGDPGGIPGIADVLVEIFLQGSFATGTCIRPAKSDDEFDADIVLSMKLQDAQGKLPNPKAVLTWLEARLRKNKEYKDKIKPKDRCIRIDYPGDFHLDVVPVAPKHGTEGVLWIPDRSEGWDQTDPKGVIAWCNQKEIYSGNRFKRITKYLKWWRSAVAPDKADVNSIILTTLIGRAVKPKSYDAETLVSVMEAITSWLDKYSEVPKVMHPTIEDDLAADWTQTEYASFKGAFKAATLMARDALDEQNEQVSIRKWQKVFGDQFPGTVLGGAAVLAGGAAFPNKPITPNKPGGFA